MQSAPRSAGSSACIDVQRRRRRRSQLARPDLALERRADQVERAGLRGDDGVVAEPAEDERPEAVAVAEGEERAVGEADDASPRPRAAPSSPRPPRRAAARRRRSAPRSPRCRRSSRAACRRPPQRVSVDEVAVVAERDRACAAVVQKRLRVLPGVRRRSSSSACGRSRARRAGRDRSLVEDLRDEAEVAQRGQAAVFADGDPGRLLAAVLQRVAGRSR